MLLEDLLVICCVIVLAISYIGYRWSSKNTYLKYKEQRAWPNDANGGKK